MCKDIYVCYLPHRVVKAKCLVQHLAYNNSNSCCHYHCYCCCYYWHDHAQGVLGPLCSGDLQISFSSFLPQAREFFFIWERGPMFSTTFSLMLHLQLHTILSWYFSYDHVSKCPQCDFCGGWGFLSPKLPWAKNSEEGNGVNAERKKNVNYISKYYVATLMRSGMRMLQRKKLTPTMESRERHRSSKFTMAERGGEMHSLTLLKALCGKGQILFCLPKISLILLGTWHIIDIY